MKRIISMLTALALAALLANGVWAAGSQESAKPAAAGQVTVEFWTFPDWGVGEAGDTFKGFIANFEKQNPNIKINFVPKADLEQAIIAGAGSKVLPDVFTVAFNQGDTFLKTGIVKDLSSYYNAMPPAFKSQFAQKPMASLSQNGKVHGLPFTAYAQLLYRNKTVLRKAGIDPAAGIKDWADWLGQMKKIKASGFNALPDLTVDGWLIMGFVGAAGGVNGVAGGKTTISAAAFEKAFQFVKDAVPYGSAVAGNDQAAVDAFITNKQAFYVMGPWQNPTFLDAQKKDPNFDYDYVLIPGPTSDTFGGTNGGEWIGVVDSPRAEAAWKWAAFLADAPQTTVFALTGRTVLNDVAMADTGVNKNVLNALTAKATKYGLADAAYFQYWPLDARTPFKDSAVAVLTGKATPAVAAAKAVSDLNQVLSDN